MLDAKGSMVPKKLVGHDILAKMIAGLPFTSDPVFLFLPSEFLADRLSIILGFFKLIL